MSKEVQGRRVLNSEECIRPGEFHWLCSGGEGIYNQINGKRVTAPLKEFAALGFMCPCGCGRLGCLYVYRKEETKEQTPGWEWDGNPDQPTLAPSIDRNKLNGQRIVDGMVT